MMSRTFSVRTKWPFSTYRAEPRNCGRSQNSILATVLFLSASLFAGCWQPSDRELVVYSALDREFAEPILKDFERQSGITVRAKYDVESTKTVGLVTALIQERNRPRCDVFWNNEILHTLRLQQLDLLAPCTVAGANQFPEGFRSPDNLWFGFAARARIMLVNTEHMAADQRPDSIHDLVDPQWANRVGIAKPLFGTTATHAAVLFATWGDQEAREFFQSLKRNVRVMGGNKQVAESVARGELLFGLTDTDDAIVEIEKGYPVAIVFPDQGDDEMGTLLIPNTVAMIRGAPHTDEARQLIEFLLTPEVESRLADGPSAQIPLHPATNVRARVLPDHDVKWMDVDFEAAAAAWDETARFLRDEFAAP